MKHARLRQAMARTLIFVSAATAIITVPACNSPRRLETLGEPMVESARAVKKEEPKKTEITLPIGIEKKIPEPKDVGEKEGGEVKKGEPRKVDLPDKERKKAMTFEVGTEKVDIKLRERKKATRFE